MSKKLAVVGGVAVVGMAGAIALPATLMAMVVGGSSDSMAQSTQGTGITTCSLQPGTATVGDLDAGQISNARTLISVGKSLHVPAHGWTIAIATALQESGLRNLDYGDRDSLGLMQQRPSSGWGTPTEVRTPAYAARAFYGGPHSPSGNTGLLNVPGWRHMPLWEAAQSVQRSAFPLAYEQHEALATDVVRRLAGKTAGCSNLSSGPWQLPVSRSYTLTSGFGPRTSPTTGIPDFHTGQDFAVPVGTRALAVSRGVVVFTGWDGGYGNLVRIRHANGVESWYGHLSHIQVHPGQRVAKGSEIGLTGSTGNSTGPHLHLEIRVDDKPTDPLPWLRAKGLNP